MKAVVLARGMGTRMRRPDANAAGDVTAEQARAADAGMKALIPFRGRPFLDYALSALADAGCRDVCLVCAPDHDEMRDYYTRTHPPGRVRVSFAVQQEARGTADAVIAARPFTGSDPFLVMNADNYYPVDVLRRLTELDGPGLPAFSRQALLREGNIRPERVAAYAILRIGADGMLEDIVEKPDPAALAALGDDFFVSMNCWRLDDRIFEACAAVPPSPRGEFELPNAVRLAVREWGQRFRTFPAYAGVLDLSHRSDIAEVARRLERIEARP